MSIKPKLGFFDLAMIVVSLVIGIGIFRTPAIVALKAGSPGIFFTAWVLGGIISVCGALTFAEIGSRYPAAGGFYKIFSLAYHPAFAFMLNWSLVITNAGSAVGVALVGAEYINPVLLPANMQGDGNVKITAVAVVLLLYGLNFLGIKMGARTQNVLSSIKIVMIVVFSLAVFGNYHDTPILAVTSPPSTNMLMALGVSLISVFFTYGGYQNTINFGADIKDPEKNIPRSIFTGIGIVVLLYLLINYAYFKVIGFDTLQHSKLPAADLAGAIFGIKGRAITSIAIFISVLGFINTSMMSNPRIYYAMADDRILPPVFKKVNEKTMTQEFALSFFAVLMLISLALLGTFEKIINYVMFIDTVSLVSAAGTIFIFRRRAKQVGTAPQTYRVKFYPWVPLLFMLMQFVVTINVLVSDTQAATYGLIIFALGYPLYLLMKRLLTANAKTENTL